MKAIKNFDWSKNLRFISYVVWWIKQSILQSLNETQELLDFLLMLSKTFISKKEVQKTGGELSSKFTSLPKTTGLDNHINDEGDTLIDLIENENSERPDASFNDGSGFKRKIDIYNVYFG